MSAGAASPCRSRHRTVSADHRRACRRAAALLGAGIRGEGGKERVDRRKGGGAEAGAVILMGAGVEIGVGG